MTNRKSFSKIQKMSFAAMMLALCGIFTILSKMIAIPGIRFASISLAPAITIFASLIFGPFYGVLVGVGGDLIGLSYSTGAYNFFYTVIAGLYGLLPWLMALLTKKFRKSLKVPYFIYAVLGIILVAMIIAMYATDYFDQPNAMSENAIWLKPFCICGCLFLEIGLAVGLNSTSNYFKKDENLTLEIPSPNEIALICLICELLLGVLGKAGGLAYYFEVLAASGSTFVNTAYPILVLFLLVIAPFNIIIDTFLVSWLCIYFYKVSSSRGYSLVEKKEPVPQIDTSSLSEEEKEAMKIHFPWGLAIFIGIILVLIIVCVIVINSIPN